MIRACELPKLLFDDILKDKQEAKGRNIKCHEVTLENGQTFKVAYLKEQEAVIGFTEGDSHIGTSKIAFLKVWNFDFKTSLRLKDLLYSIPDYQIIAGTSYGEECHPTYGQAIHEDIIAQNNTKPNVLGFCINNPFRIFISFIEDVARTIQRDKMPPKRQTYWARYYEDHYLEPEKNKTKPP